MADRNTSAALSRRAMLLLGGAAVAVVGFGLYGRRASATEGRAIPAPELDPALDAATETAVIAGGCFWGVQGVYQHVEGVSNAVSGYAGGKKEHADYDLVSTGMTQHAEAVRIVYDPRKVSYARILQIFFSVAHDPTQLNFQGPDIGPQYRSTIFPQGEEQARIAKAYIAQLDKAGAFDAKIVTTIEAEKEFYPAEDFHQDFMTRNPTYPYIVIHDLPKLANLKRLFPDRYRDKPALVADARQAE